MIWDFLKISQDLIDIYNEIIYLTDHDDFVKIKSKLDDIEDRLIKLEKQLKGGSK